MHIGIIGPPQSGKTTIFQALSAHQATMSGKRNEPTRVTIEVPDARVDRLVEMFEPKKVVHATVEYLDIAHPGGNEPYPHGYLQHFRSADALAVVLPCMAVVSEDGEEEFAQAIDLFQTLELGLIMNDLQQIEKKLATDRKVLQSKRNDPQFQAMVTLMERLYEHLESEQPLRDMELSELEQKQIRGFTFLSRKPQIAILNLDETLLPKREEFLRRWREAIPQEGLPVLAVPGQVEAELSELDPEEQAVFMAEYGLEEAALPALIRASYETLGLLSFFTVGPKEVHAWTIKQGATAQQAAGAIHSDLERGFIRAEVIAWDTLLDVGSLKAAKDTGDLRLEGKEYPVKDGEIVHIRSGV